MIPLLIWFSLLLAWLGYETDWFRVRLLFGVYTPDSEHQYATWDKLKPWQIRKTDATWLRFPDIIAPLTGWDWLKNTMHIIPEYRIELIGETYKTTITSHSTQALGDAFRVNRNPWLRVKLN